MPNDSVTVLSGVEVGEHVVAEGSFAVRAERERLGLRPSAGASTNAGEPATGSHAAAREVENVQEAAVTVSASGFEPAFLSLRAGVPARLTFTRTSAQTCATSVVFASLEIRRDLPLDEPITIEFTPRQTGEIVFACGTNMLRGTVVVQ